MTYRKFHHPSFPRPSVPRRQRSVAGGREAPGRPNGPTDRSKESALKTILRTRRKFCSNLCPKEWLLLQGANTLLSERSIMRNAFANDTEILGLKFEGRDATSTSEPSIVPMSKDLPRLL